MTDQQVIDRLSVIQADITTLEVDAIVNAANATLLGGGGVDGAIHRAAGRKLKAYCRSLGGCKTGEAVTTPAFNLPARYIIHTVGPIWDGGVSGEKKLLRQCYRNSLLQAIKNNAQTIAFPAISTGIYGYPLEMAAKTAVNTVAEFLQAYSQPASVIFCCFSAFDAGIYQKYIDILTESELA